MSTTDAALDWLLSLSATLTSSPVPNSDSPDFTDWLRVSPTTSSPATSEPPSSSQASVPFQDVTSSSRVNLPQTRGLGLNYFYDLSDRLSPTVSATSASQNGRVLQDTRISGQDHAYNQPAAFNEHNRMVSLDSVTATLVNTPSPRSTQILSAGVLRNQNDVASPFSSLFYSPTTKYMQDLQDTTFGSYLTDLVVPLPPRMPSDVSPVVRASTIQEHTSSDDNPERNRVKIKSKSKKNRRSKHIKADVSFLEKLQAIDIAASTQSTSDAASRDALALAPLSDIPTEAPLITPVTESVLLSPCRLEATGTTLTRQETNLPLPILPMLSLENTIAHVVLPDTPSTPQHSLTPIEALSPLTPLSSVASSPPIQLPRLKIIINLKRERDGPGTAEADPAVRRSKRPRKMVAFVESPSPSSSTEEPLPLLQPSAQEDPRPIYTRRTLPATVEVSENFPLFYRRFPASSYYMHGTTESPCTLFGMAHPGGGYNPPRCVLDLYTPRFVKGKGIEKVGLCPICIEPFDRGGEKKKLWLAMKFSAFKCYHMQYAHGICAATGRPFSPPTAFRIIPRQNPGKKEKVRIQQGKCHKCNKWVAVEGIKDMESKVKELHWWKHAAACHQESNLAGECNYFENDHVLATLLSLKTKQEAKD